MMKKRAALMMMVGFFAIALKAQNASVGDEQNKLLENELTLARKAASYVIINLQDKSISLKAKGIVLRKWDIQSSKSWGRPVGPAPYKMTKKSALSQPKRPDITPGQEEKKTKDKEKKEAFDLGVLELKDMPIHYDLSFDENIYISVRPKTKRFWPSLMNIGKTISWFTYLPMKTIWHVLKKKPFTEIEIVMKNEKDAQGVYWSFLDGQSTIIYQPKTN
jgi:hypothetical protein